MSFSIFFIYLFIFFDITTVHFIIILYSYFSPRLCPPLLLNCTFVIIIYFFIIIILIIILTIDILDFLYFS